MRLFGTPGGSLNKARATYGFLPPFDLSLKSAAFAPGGFTYIVPDQPSAFAVPDRPAWFSVPDRQALFTVAA